MGAQTSIAVPLDLARLIDKVFLPINPNRLRGAHPSVVQAAHKFKALIAGAHPAAAELATAEEVARALAASDDLVAGSTAGIARALLSRFRITRREG